MNAHETVSIRIESDYCRLLALALDACAFRSSTKRDIERTAELTNLAHYVRGHSASVVSGQPVCLPVSALAVGVMVAAIEEQMRAMCRVGCVEMAAKLDLVRNELREVTV